MTSLPSGTVSLLFSDIEGSTQLLSRLGPVYSDALAAHRQVLRKAWAQHHGTEMGTEGDSFFVAFSTAEDAALAAIQAQRELATYPWPDGEQVLVRMGIHTGTPTVHDDEYVGMDVHRAARLAGAAHGGQVLLSEVTAQLVGDLLSPGVGLRDLGSHRLKDIASPEHLFQLTIDGLPAEFPAPRALGAVSNLPKPATPLIGRDGEQVELSALLRSAAIRLLTLTGPGGSGKTRLAISVAESLVTDFPDGVFFVPLAAVTTSPVMWTTIAEVLDLPAETRTPVGVINHVAHRRAVFVLDNLEQLAGADEVVNRLLQAAQHVVLLATSRRPLRVNAEHEHPVPPLELPAEATFSEAETSGAVQLFAQHARMVRPTFRLTADNAADVVEVCRRLDGLPLAVELAASRSKLLTPRALVARLNQALDLAARDKRTPRQHTVRETIAWSYNLLAPREQALFRRMGVFAGGADLDAITAVADDILLRTDPFDLVSELVDDSLLTIGEDSRGEPRLGMLQTVRAFALDELQASGESDAVQDRHARHFLDVAEKARPLLTGERHLLGRGRFEAEHDNFRAALAWVLPTRQSPGTPAQSRVILALSLCGELSLFWHMGGYWDEARQWLLRATSAGRGLTHPAMARCQIELADSLRVAGDLGAAYDHAAEGVAMCRRTNSEDDLSKGLATQATVEMLRGHNDAGDRLFSEAVRVARSRNERRLYQILGNYAWFQQSAQRNPSAALELFDEALKLAQGRGDRRGVIVFGHNKACALRDLGQLGDAEAQMRAQIPDLLEMNEPDWLVTAAEDYATVLAQLGDHRGAATLLGAADATRERLSLPRNDVQGEDIAPSIARARTGLTAAEWEAAYLSGSSISIEAALSKRISR